MHAMKAQGRVRYIYEGEWSASHAGRFTTEKTDVGMHYILRWLSPGADPNTLEKKIYCPCRESNLDSLAGCIPSTMSRLLTFN